jgi:hypothetical protein
MVARLKYGVGIGLLVNQMRQLVGVWMQAGAVAFVVRGGCRSRTPQ